MKLNILLVGAGMYVCGRGTPGFGTILPTIFEGVKAGLVGDIHLVARSEDSVCVFNRKRQELVSLMGVDSNIETFVNPDGMVALETALANISGPACAIVSVPDHLHCQITLPILNSKIPALVVKPLAPTLKEVDQLIETGEENGVYAAVEFHKRFDRANRFLRDEYRNGRVGDLLYVLVEYSQRKLVPTEIFKAWSHKTNIFQYLGIHYVDIVYFVTGARPKRVMATGQKRFLENEGIDTYDSIQVQVEWETPSGQTFNSIFLTNWIDPNTTSAMSDQKIKLIGTKGRIEADQKNRGVQVVDDDSGIEDVNPDFCRFYKNTGQGKSSIMGYGVESVLTFLNDVRDIEEGKTTLSDLEKSRPTFKQARVSTKITEAANLSLQSQGNWVTMDEH